MFPEQSTPDYVNAHTPQESYGSEYAEPKAVDMEEEYGRFIAPELPPPGTPGTPFEAQQLPYSYRMDTSPYTLNYGGVGDVETAPFKLAYKAAAVNNALLIATTVAGISIDKKIEELVGQEGYGVLLGLTLGNAARATATAAPFGGKAITGALSGALVPVIPIVGLMALKRPLNKTSGGIILAFSVLGLASVYVKGLLNFGDDE